MAAQTEGVSEQKLAEDWNAGIFNVGGGVMDRASLWFGKIWIVFEDLSRYSVFF